jgi:hypothetical protein
MDIQIGVVRSIKHKMVGILKTAWSVVVSTLATLWNSSIAVGSDLMTRIVQHLQQSLHVVTQWSIERLYVLSLILLVWLTKLGIIIVKPIHSVLGSLLQKIVAQHRRLVLILQKVGK